jgi:vitamin B12 transporter
MRHIDKQTKTPTRKKIIPLALAAIVSGGGGGPLWAQTASTLDTVVVTASRAQERVREVSSNVTIITENDIKASTASTVADILMEQGFNAVTTGDTTGVQIRGFGTLSMPNEYENTILFLLNGRRTGNSNAAVMGLANVERIEIIRGPSAVQYGSSALGGVINVITRQGKEGKPVISVEAGLGSDNLTREKLAVSGAANGFDYALGASNYKRDDLTTSKFGRWYHTAIDHNTMANLDLGYTFDKNHRVGLSYNHGDIKSDLPGSNGGVRGDVWGYPPSYLGPNHPDNEYTRYSKKVKNTALSYTGSAPDKKFDWQASYASGGYDTANKNPVTGAKTYETHVDTEFLNAQAGYNGSMVSLSAGLDRYSYDIDSNGVKSTMEDTGMYATGKLRLLDERLIFSAGLRRDWYDNKSKIDKSRKDEQTTGSLGVAFQPMGWLKLRANYAEGFKMPSPGQIAGDGGVYYAPNASLKPEKSKTYEFGADVNWQYVDASLTYFHSDWTDKIVGLSYPGGICTGGYGCYQNQNIKKSEIAGVEGSLRADLGKAFKWNWSLAPYVSFTWLGTLKNKDESRWFTTYDGNQKKILPNTPEWMASFGVDYAHPGYKIKSRLNANYYGARYTSNYGVTRPSGYFMTGGGTVVNWSLDKELADFSDRYGRLTLRTEINNLFDSANEMYWGYPGAGRSFYVGLRYDFL